MLFASSLRRRVSLALASGCLALLACADDEPAQGGNAQGGSPASGGQGQGAAPATGTGGASAGGEAPTTSSGGDGEGGTVVDPWAGPLVSLKELDLGDVEIGQDSKFVMPDRVLGVTTLSTTPETGLFGIATLRPPLGGSVIFNFEVPGTDLPVFIDEFALNGGNPQSDLADAWPIKTGNWRLRLASDKAPLSAHSWVYVRRTLDGAYHGGVLDVNVLIAPGSGASQNYMSTVVSNLFDDYYGPLLGLSQGTVTFGSVPGSFDVIGSDQEYKQLLSSSSTASPAPAVNLFVVGDFSGDLDNALGIAGGIPGSPMVHGTGRSGVAYTPTGDQNYDASVLAHEIGHLGGLFHTTEFQVVAFDPLADTPECPNINEMNPGNCPDVDNVMFPIAYGGFQLSTLQQRTMHGSALYRGILESGGAPSPPLLPVNVDQDPVAVESGTFELPLALVPTAEASLPRLLSSHWCARSGDVEARVAEIVNDDDALLAILDDDGAFDLARGRALRLLSRRAESARARRLVIDRAVAALASPLAGRRLRIAAIVALDALSPGALALAVRTTPALEDPVIVRHLELRGL